MNAQKLVMTTTTLIGGAVGLFAPIGVVKLLFGTDPEDAGILTLFSCGVMPGGPVNRAQGRTAMTGEKRLAQR
jgi:hypothetical protein